MNNLIEYETEYGREKVDLIKREICNGASDNELALFLSVCKRTQLDPFSRQIYCIPRNTWDSKTRTSITKYSTQFSIDGFRAIAERSGSYAGQGEPEYVYNENKLDCVKVRVYRFSSNGQRYEAAVGVAFWDEYCQRDKEGNPTSMWKKMPKTMLAKCAEALALRKAFPQDLSGLYTTDEMMQAEDTHQSEEKNITPNISLEIYAKALELAESGKKDECKQYISKQKPKISKKEYEEMVAACAKHFTSPSSSSVGVH